MGGSVCLSVSLFSLSLYLSLLSALSLSLSLSHSLTLSPFRAFRLFSASKLTNLYRTPGMSTLQKSVNPKADLKAQLAAANVKAGGDASRVPPGLADFPKVDMPDVRYKSVNFGASTAMNRPTPAGCRPASLGLADFFE